MAKTVSGEVEFKHDDETITFRLDFEAVSQIEERLDMSIFEVIPTGGGIPKVSTMTVLAEAMTGGKLSGEAVFKIMRSGKMIDFARTIALCIANTFDPQKKALKAKKPKASRKS